MTGSTPNNLAHILGTVVSEINKYKNYIASMPRRESRAIYQDRGVYKYSILSRLGGETCPVTWEKIGDNLSFESLSQYFPVSKYSGYTKSIEFRANPICRKGGAANPDIDFELRVLRLNIRNEIKELYRAPNGSLSVTLDESVLNGDDLFIVGFVPLQNIISSATYYVDLSYSVVVHGQDNSLVEAVNTVGDCRIGNILFDADTSATESFMLWDILSLNRFTVSCTNSIGDNSTIFPRDTGDDLGGEHDGNIIESISSGGIDLNISEFKISYRNLVSSSRLLIEDSYAFFDMKRTGINKIVFKNIRPIDIVLEEAINAL